MSKDTAALEDIKFRAQKIREGRDLVAATFELLNRSISSEEWLAKIAALANCEKVACVWWRAGCPDEELRDSYGGDIALTRAWKAKVDAALEAARPVHACLLDEIPGLEEDGSDAIHAPTRLVAVLDWKPSRILLCLDGRRDEAEWQDSDRYRFSNLLPVLQNSVESKKQLSWREDIIDLSNKIFDSMPRGFISVMPDRTVISRNKVARDLLAQHALIRVENNRIRFAEPKLDAEFGRQLAAMEQLATTDLNTFAWFKNLNKSTTDNTVLLTMKAFNLDLWRREASPYNRIALLVLDVQGIHAVPTQMQLCEFYQLTPAQARVVQALCTNVTIEEVSDRLHVSINTVRAHLRAIYAKLGVTNKSQLLRIISLTSTEIQHDDGERS